MENQHENKAGSPDFAFSEVLSSTISYTANSRFMDDL